MTDARDHTADPELALLGEESIEGCFSSNSEGEGVKNAPIFTGDAFEVVGTGVFPQRALYGRIIAQEASGTQSTFKSPKLYFNTNAPFSAIVCGVQGSGKSHSTSVLMESCLIRDQRLGTLPQSLSALLFHFGTAAGGGHVRPCEAAYIASPDIIRGGTVIPPNVIVLVLPNSLRGMRQAYSEIPEVSVQPLHFAQEEINGERLLAMMKVDQDQHMPLYMECVMSILRSMVDTFSYEEFRRQIKEQKFSSEQKSMLNLRLSLLDECLASGVSTDGISKHFRKGQLTIVDLSSPFMDSSSACGFFDIILGLFVETKTETRGKLVVLDEAHKYLTTNGSSSRLTESLLSVVREQRHLGTRVLISTQEPTVVPPQFLDLCSFVIAHRFSSPNWLDHLKKHVSSANSEWFSKVSSLKTGEAMIFAPAGVGLRRDPPQAWMSLSDTQNTKQVAQLGQGYILVRSRDRVTRDGGRSVLATWDDAASPPNSTLVDTGSGGSGSLESKLGYGAQMEFTTPLDLEKDGHNINDQPTTKESVSSVSSDASWRSKFTRDRGVLVQPPPVQSGTINPLSGTTPEPISITPWSPKIATASTQVLTARPLNQIEARFRPLAVLLQGYKNGGTEHMEWSKIGAALKKLSPAPYTGKLTEYLEEAADAQLIEVGGREPQRWVQLLISPQIPVSPEYKPLVDILRRLQSEGVERPMCSVAAEKMYAAYPRSKGMFRPYAEAAQEAGIVNFNRGSNRISLISPYA